MRISEWGLLEVPSRGCPGVRTRNEIVESRVTNRGTAQTSALGVRAQSFEGFAIFTVVGITRAFSQEAIVHLDPIACSGDGQSVTNRRWLSRFRKRQLGS